jgi:hypothetical protein
MAYKIEVNPEYVHVMFTGEVDMLDMVTLLSVDEFIENIRSLKRVIYDYTLCVSSAVLSDDMQELSFLSNIESNITEEYFAVCVPIDETARERFSIFKSMIKSDKWVLELADNTAEAIALIKQNIPWKNTSQN